MAAGTLAKEAGALTPVHTRSQDSEQEIAVLPKASSSTSKSRLEATYIPLVGMAHGRCQSSCKQ